jgi:putative ABC transport system permease protein
MVDLALKSLLHDKLRFAITVAGVAFAVTLIFVQFGLFFGLLDNASLVIEHTDADLWVTSRNTPNIDFAQQFPETHVNRVRSIPGVERADNLIVTFMNVALPTGAQETTEIYALEDFARWGIPWHIESGDINNLRRGPYVFFDASAVRRFGEFNVGDYREVLDRRLRIIGKTRDALSFTTTPITFMDYRLAQSMQPSLLKGKTSYMLVKLKPGVDREAVRKEMQRRLPYNDVHTSEAWAKQSRDYWIKSTGIGLNMFVTIFLGGLVGVVIVAQTLYSSTMEHLKEFGTVKAIGGSNMDIYRILGKQALIAAIVGYIIGLAMSWSLSPAMGGLGLKLIMPMWLHIAIFIGTIVLCLGAAAVSFHKVASIDPALVFRT